MENKDIKRIYISIMDIVEDYDKAIDITCRILYAQGVVTESYYHAILENIKKYVIMLKIEIDRTMRKDEVQWQTQLLQLRWKMEM